MVVYSPLRSHRREIRLLTLDPGEDGDPIQLRIQTADLNSADEYTCLSYAWGPPDPKRSIDLDGCPVDVRENLYLALVRLRLRDRPRRLWIDALCINQDDVKERQAQVSIMQHIYHTATNVIAWIGEDNGAPDKRAIDFMRELGAKSESRLAVGIEEDPSIHAARPRSVSLVDDDTVKWLESVTPFGLVDSAWLDLTALLARPWFSRIWIVQEVVMGREVTVQCGPHQFGWTELHYSALFVHAHAEFIRAFAAPECLRYHDPKKAEFFATSLPVYRLFRAAEDIRSVGSLALTQLMQRTVREITEPTIREHLARARADAGQPSHLWWAMSEDLRTLYFSSSRPPDTGNGHHAILAPTDTENPHHHPSGPDSSGIRLGSILAKVDNMPIYSTQPSTAAENPPTNTACTVWDVISRFRTFDATDPRDKVYALLGIASEVEYIRAVPPISYRPETHVLDAFWNVIDAHLRSRNDLDFLGEACGIDRPEGFPSWMPLWYDDDSHVQSTAAPLGRLQQAPAVVYRASGGVKARAVLHEKSRTLGVSGRIVGRVESLSEVYDRDAERPERLAARRRWAEMLGLGAIERLDQVLTALKLTKRLSDDEAEARLEAALGKLLPAKRALYRRFVGTLMASASEEGIGQLCHPPAGTRSSAMAEMLGSATGLGHVSHPWELHVDGRVAAVCHGRRMFVCDTGGKPGHNFGLCPGNTRQGDFVALFLGSNMLHVIRQVGVDEGEPIFGLVGDAYVQNCMAGQLLEEMRMPGRPDLWRVALIMLR